MSLDIKKHFDKDNLHHAYLIEGEREEILSENLKLLESFGVKTNANPDFLQISLDTFKIDDARNLKSFAIEKANTVDKKIFIISANNFLLEAQNSLLKMFEEPIDKTHFFLITPDTNALLKTLVSRFYFISTKSLSEGEQDAEKFIQMPLQKRIDFIKELLTEVEEQGEEGNKIAPLNSSRSKALKFLNAIETLLHRKFEKNFFGFTLPGVPGGSYTVQNSFQICFDQIFKVRKFLRQPGSSTKTLMESVAIVIPML